MRLPKPFGMRWFGVFAVVLAIGSWLDLVLPHGLLAYVAVVVLGGLVMVGLSELSATVKSWMLGDW